jgi:hypothetical protein
MPTHGVKSIKFSVAGQGEGMVRLEEMVGKEAGKMNVPLNGKEGKAGSVEFSYVFKDLPKQEVTVTAKESRAELNTLSNPTKNMLKRLNFGDKIFENQSSATLQSSIVAFSFPKG